MLICICTEELQKEAIEGLIKASKIYEYSIITWDEYPDLDKGIQRDQYFIFQLPKERFEDKRLSEIIESKKPVVLFGNGLIAANFKGVVRNSISDSLAYLKTAT